MDHCLLYIIKTLQSSHNLIEFSVQSAPTVFPITSSLAYGEFIHKYGRLFDVLSRDMNINV